MVHGRTHDSFEEFMTLLPDSFAADLLSASPRKQGVPKIDCSYCRQMAYGAETPYSLTRLIGIFRSPAGLRSTQLALSQRSLMQASSRRGKRLSFSAGTLFSSQGSTPAGRESCGQRKTPGKEHRRALERPGQLTAQVPEALRFSPGPRSSKYQSKGMPTFHLPVGPT